MMIYLTDKFHLRDKLSSVTGTKFSNKNLLYIILTELLIGQLVYFGLKSTVLTLLGHTISGLNVLSIYLLVFSVYHNGEFFFVLWCHTDEVSWKSKIFIFSNFFVDFNNFDSI